MQIRKPRDPKTTPNIRGKKLLESLALDEDAELVFVEVVGAVGVAGCIKQ